MPAWMEEAAVSGEIVFWKFNCREQCLEISSLQPLWCGTKGAPVPQEDTKIVFGKYLDRIPAPERERFLQIVSGKSPGESGSFTYLVSGGEKSVFHTCHYTVEKTQEEEYIAGTIRPCPCPLEQERASREEEFLFGHIANYSGIGLFSWEPFNEKSYISRRWYENFGLLPGRPLEVSMKEWTSRIHPGDYEIVKTATGQLRRGEKNYMDVVFRLYVEDNVRWLRYTVLIFRGDWKNKDVQVIGMNQDVTASKLEEMRNTRIIEAIPDFIFIFDDEFYIRDILKSREIVLLHPDEQLINASGRSIFSPEVSDLYEQTIRRCLEEQSFQEIEYPLEVEGSRYYFQARMVPFDRHKVMALIHDITEKVKNTQDLVRAKLKAEEADRMKSAFLANMSHEIRTPLNAIVGFAEVLYTAEDPQEKEEYMEIIRANSNILLQLINDVLDLSRIESGKTQIIRSNTDLVGLVGEVRRVHALKTKPGVELKTEIPSGIRELWINTDHNRVSQVLFNFMSNAIKNTEKGCITLGLTLGADNTVGIWVRDTGPGIPKEKLDFIFERFAKLNDFVQGTGLGLNICQSIARRLGGRIEVESEYGKGSMFTLVFPG